MLNPATSGYDATHRRLTTCSRPRSMCLFPCFSTCGHVSSECLTAIIPDQCRISGSAAPNLEPMNPIPTRASGGLSLNLLADATPGLFSSSASDVASRLFAAPSQFILLARQRPGAGEHGARTGNEASCFGALGGPIYEFMQGLAATMP